MSEAQKVHTTKTADHRRSVRSFSGVDSRNLLMIIKECLIALGEKFTATTNQAVQSSLTSRLSILSLFVPFFFVIHSFLSFSPFTYSLSRKLLPTWVGLPKALGNDTLLIHLRVDWRENVSIQSCSRFRLVGRCSCPSSRCVEAMGKDVKITGDSELR